MELGGWVDGRGSKGTWREVICGGLLDWEGDAVVACSAFSRLRVQWGAGRNVDWLWNAFVLR